jgi:predicted HTH domain antitoxin
MATIGVSAEGAKELLAISLYQLRKINGVQGGKIIGKSEFEFHELLGRYGQTLAYDENDLLADMNTLRNL